MKKVVLLFLFVSSCIVFGQTTQKTGWVNLQSILAQYPVAIKAQSDIDAYVAKKQKELDSMKVALQGDYAKYQQQVATMTPDTKKATEQQLATREQSLMQFQQRIFGQPNGEVYAMNETLFAPVREKIFTAIEAVAKEQGMVYVLDKSTEAVVVYADSEFDITFKVLDRLNKK